MTHDLEDALRELLRAVKRVRECATPEVLAAMPVLPRAGLDLALARAGKLLELTERKRGDADISLGLEAAIREEIEKEVKPPIWKVPTITGDPSVAVGPAFSEGRVDALKWVLMKAECDPVVQ